MNTPPVSATAGNSSTSNTTSGKRQLGIWMCTSLVIGNMIGSGIFLLPSSLAALGPISIGGWLFTGAGALLLALIFSRLSQMLPSAGGPYAYCRQGLGEFMGYLIAWGYWIGLWTGNAAIVVAMTGYLGTFFPVVSNNPIIGMIVAQSAVWILSWLNIRGVKNVGTMQLVTTVLKLLPLLAITVGGLFFMAPENFSPVNLSEQSNFGALTSSAALTLWAFLGLESATVPAENVKDPQRTIPRSTILGTLFAALLYIIATISLMGLIPPAELAGSTAPFADAAIRMWGQWGGYAVSIGAIISCLGALNGWTLMSAQVPMAAARHGLFPACFSRLNRKGTPAAGIIINAIMISLLLAANFSRGLVELFNFVINLAVMTTLLPYTMATVAYVLLKIRGTQTDSQLKTSDVVIAALAFIYSVWALAGSGPEIVYWGFLLLLAGIPIYLWMKWQQRHQPQAEMLTP
ncbi:amino acid permease [Endozoicomonadaceae bacterium StTr2]